ncbi:hypothetical protein [Xenorhabdus innexi]|uniref:NgrE n=1 Tax=Xenorhabdus innexi TaxID=290109 RepID=A0A1N6N1V6_9GAMM|nr:hypothetical protein [Xenorhabdus innexi]PHM37205.1 NgrE [Xenorhabdus innexi]SIP75014.1 conserved hypothetical protein [Xenorhabdus innexi]
MIYTQGTISTVSGSAMVRGTGTQFKDNLNGVAPGQVILIQSGSSNLLHMIQAVNSDTELVLADKATVTLNNVTYQIQTTVPNSISDGVRHLCAINSHIITFLQNMDKWMTQNGVVDLTLPNGQTVSLQSIKALQASMLDKNRNGADIPNKAAFTQNIGAVSASGGNYQGYFRFKQVETLPNERNAVMLVSTKGGQPENAQVAFTSYGWYENYVHTGIIRGGGADTMGYAIDINARRVLTIDPGTITLNSNSNWGGLKVYRPSGTHWRIESAPDDSNVLLNFIDRDVNSLNKSVQTLPKGSGTILSLGTNCWRDSNGFIKASSPILQIHPDGTFITNDESEGATVTKLNTGHYQVTGVLGYNSDKAWGVHGGISSPKNNNGLELIYIDDKVNKDGSITIETFHRQHSHLPERFQNKRIKALIDGEKVYYQDGEPCDIPEGCRLDVRVQMPENSVWNLKQKAAAERVGDGEPQE